METNTCKYLLHKMNTVHFIKLKSVQGSLVHYMDSILHNCEPSLGIHVVLHKHVAGDGKGKVVHRGVCMCAYLVKASRTVL